MKTKAIHIGFIAGFLILLTCPAIVWLSGWKEKTISSENKRPAALPKFDARNLESFPSKYEAWFNDHFPARNSLIFGYNYVYARYFEKSPKPQYVLIGTAGWLYLTNNEMNIYTGKLHFSEWDLKKELAEIEYRHQKCAEQGAEYRIIIIPSKQTVYPEHLPLVIEKYPGPNATDQFVDYMQKHSDVPVLDLRPLLVSKKKMGQLFTKGDNHWNGLGTFLAYQEIIRWLGASYKIKPALDISEVEVRDTLERGGNITDMIGMAEYWKNRNTLVVPVKPSPWKMREKQNYTYPADFPYVNEYEMGFQNKDTTLPGVLIMRDSFTNTLLRNLLSSHFGRSTFIWDKWEHRLNLDIVKKEKPKLVLCILVESFVGCFEDYPDAPAKDKK